jgi:tetratricopeptide (TPR) repeat protein
LDAALVMHLDRYVDGARHGLLMPWHLDCALLLFDAYAPLDDQAVHLRSSYVIAWLLQVAGQFEQLQSHLDSALKAYPRAIELHVARGVLAEAEESPRYASGNRSSFGGLEAAEAAYRAGLAIDPGAVAARLRLGYVLLRAKKVSTARAELTSALSTATSPRDMYLAALFLGSVHETSDDLPNAVLAYERAAAALPGCQVASIALGNAQGLVGRLDASRDIVAKAGDIGPEACEDPWWSYDYGQAWQIEDSLQELRRLVRK